MKNYQTKGIDFSLLILRVVTALMIFINHGWVKIISFEKSFHNFPDPIGISNEASYILIVFAELFCSVLLIFGLFTRYAVIPLIIAMLVAVFIVHGNDVFAQQELGILYLIPFIVLLVSGPGKYSLDAKFKI